MVIPIVVVIFLISEVPAHAYIDPGTGSLIYQTALAVILGLGFVLRRSRSAISRFVKRLSGRDVASEAARDDRD